MDVASIADWTDPKQVNTRRGPRLVRHATPDERFWHAWKMDKPAVKEAGVSLKKKDDGTWEATLWEELPQEEQKAMVAAVESSRAVDADISVPSPDGLEYLPFQRAGIAYVLRSFGVAQ